MPDPTESDNTPAEVQEVTVDNGPSETDLQAQSVIDQIAEEWAANPPPEDSEGEAPAVPAEEAPPAGAKADEAVPPQEAAPEEKPEDRGLERLVAREVEIRRREETVSAREKVIGDLEQKLAALEQERASLPLNLINDLGVTPRAALKAAGHDPDHVMRLFLAEKFASEGKPVPPELQTHLDKAETKRQIQELQNQLLQSQRQAAAAAFVAQVEAGAREYVKQGISKDAPTVARVAKANPDRVHSEILDEIARDAQSRAGKEPNGAVLTYEEAAKRVEKRWSEYQKLLADGQAPAPAASTTAAATSASKAAPTGASATKPPAVKPPAKPLTARPPVSDDELMRDAIKAAEAEFRRVEQLRRQPNP